MSSSTTEDRVPGAGNGLPRVVDIGAAGLGLLITSPVLVLIALAVKLGSSGSVLFRQQRVGKGGQLFTLLKFRSMTTGTGGPEITATGDTRITAVGRLVSQTKLDELPSLWNVVRGDMALVGPRPEVPRYVDLQNPGWRFVLSVRPGLTDPVTVSLRNEEELLGSVEDPEAFYRETLRPYKVRAYADYLKTRSAWSDAKLLLTTLLAIVVPARTPPPSIEEIRRRVDSGRE